MRDVQMMLMVLGCKSPNAIADSLNLFAQTGSSYRYRVFEKLGVKNDDQLTLLAVWHNVTELDTRGTSGGEDVAVLSNWKGPFAVRQQSHEALEATLGISSDDEHA